MTSIPPLGQSTEELETASTDQALIMSLMGDFDEAASLREHWDNLIIELQGELYGSHDWCRIWWKHYGQGRDLQIFVFHVGDQLVGIVPMFRERLWLCGGLRIAKLVGCDSALAICSLPIRRPWAVQALEQILSHWLNKAGCDAVWFGPLNGSDCSAEVVREASGRLGPGIRLARNAVMGVHSTFHLESSFDEYVQQLDKRQRQNYRRDMNLLTRTFKMDSDVITGEEPAMKEFEAFRVMHTAQWAAQGKLGHFEDWPRGLDFNRDLIREYARLGRFRLYRLLANGGVVSYQYGFCLGDRFCWRLPARPVQLEWDRFGLGRFGLMKMIEAAISEGVRHIEAGCGHYEYKVQLGAKEYPLVSMLVSSHHVGSRLRCHYLALVSRVLHLLYYRIWFNRIAPRLPLRRRPLWRSWIKTRL